MGFWTLPGIPEQWTIKQDCVTLEFSQFFYKQGHPTSTDGEMQYTLLLSVRVSTDIRGGVKLEGIKRAKKGCFYKK